MDRDPVRPDSSSAEAMLLLLCVSTVNYGQTNPGVLTPQYTRSTSRLDRLPTTQLQAMMRRTIASCLIRHEIGLDTKKPDNNQGRFDVGA